MRLWIIFAGLSGLSAVGLSAWGAHGLVDSPTAQGWVERASQYQLLHSLAVVAAAWLSENTKRGAWEAHAAAAAFALGILMFCGSLYVRAATGQALPVPMITPAGGMTLMAGWALLALAGLRK